MIAPDTFGTPVQGLDIGYINSGALEL